ncbi:GNAT family N-acetyltransferase [soil metagenome]
MTDPTEPRAAVVDLDIAPARAGDADEIIALQRAAYRIEAERYDDFGLPPLTETPTDLVAALDTHTVLVARRHDGAVVGTARARIRGDTAHIARLSVRPDLHGHGIGRQLLRAIEQATAPVRRYELFTGHRSDRNLRMYERAGYRRVRNAPQSDAVVLIYLEKLVDVAERA